MSKKRKKKNSKTVLNKIDIANRYDTTLKELLDNRTLMKQLITGFIEKEWVKDLKSKYPVVINEKVLSKLIEREESEK